MKKTLDKKELENVFLEAMEKGHKVAVSITVPGCEKTESIVNPPENLENKLDYYMSSYNDDLKLRAYPAIQIVGIVSGETIKI